MAGDWIKMRTDLHDDPAVFRLASMLKMDRFAVVGRLHAFWSWADKHAVDGRVDGATPQLVDTVVTHDGFADAMMVVAWLTHDDKGIAIPQFERHNGKSAKERALKNQRQTRWRGRGGGVDGRVDGAVVAKPSTREEKRREDITPAAAVTLKDLIADGLKEQTAVDFLARRREKRAKLTVTAWDGIKSEATKAGWTLDRAIRKALERGWQSFDAAWVRTESPQADEFAGCK